MNIQVIMKTARSITFLLDDGGIYNTKENYKLSLNGKEIKQTTTVVTSLYSLCPDTAYHMEVKNPSDELVETLEFCTEKEFVTLNVREFGALGDGASDDTGFIQAAIMACPKGGRVLIPRGTYRITSIFLKSELNLELADGAELVAETDRNRFAKFPGMIQSYDETEDYNLGTWEGNPLPMFASILTGIDVSNVNIYGQGTINGCATHENWWHNEKVMIGAFRPRLLFLERCKNIQVQGIHFCNSPAWTIHPYFSENLMFTDLTINNPQVSPNTDGLDPESCKNVEIIGVHFSLGDDCIAVKSGKVYMGRKYKVACEHVHVCQCLMEHGHGAVTVGSEIGAGVNDIVVEKCRFYDTDRGLRIKTRRGRGKDSVLDGIVFRDIDMDHVMTPFTANAFYFCDPDGRTEYVQSRAYHEVDERTPVMKTFRFENIKATNCHVAAAYFAGLPESKIERLELINCKMDFAKSPRSGVPIMSNGVEECTNMGIHAENIHTLVIEDVEIKGQSGDVYDLRGVEYLVDASGQRINPENVNAGVE